MKFLIKRYKKLASTNTTAKNFAGKGASEGLVIVADYQTHGRGKPGNQWFSPPKKNLLFSLLIRPPLKAHQAPMVTQIACRSVATVLRDQYQIDSLFKKPNDILVQGKKICGILVESSGRTGQEIENMVIGIGLNVHAKPAPDSVSNTICMKDVRRKEYNRGVLLKGILDQLGKDLGALYAHTS